MTGVVANSTRSSPSCLGPESFVVLFTGMLPRAVSPCGTSISTSNVALRWGSSKHGKANLAWQGSKCVASTTALSPSRSLVLVDARYLARKKPTMVLPIDARYEILMWTTPGSKGVEKHRRIAPSVPPETFIALQISVERLVRSPRMRSAIVTGPVGMGKLRTGGVLRALRELCGGDVKRCRMQDDFGNRPSDARLDDDGAAELPFRRKLEVEDGEPIVDRRDGWAPLSVPA